jgi:hypothetical protein
VQQETCQLLELGFVTNEYRNVGVPQQFLESRQVEPIHDVMIQDLLIKKR